MPSSEREFSARVGRLLGQLEQAERAALLRVQSLFEDARKDLFAEAARDQNAGTAMSAAVARIDALDQGLAEQIRSEHSDAVERGIIIVDSSLAVVDPRTSAAFVMTDTLVDKRAFMLSRAALHSAVIKDRIVAALMRRTTGADLAETLGEIGEEVEGSAIFGKPANDTVGMVRAGLGDTTGAAMMDRVGQAAAEGRPRTLKRWVHRGARDPRSEHVIAESRYSMGIAWGAKFKIGSYSTPYPRGPGLPGSHRFGCRCQLAPVLAPEE